MDRLFVLACILCVWIVQAVVQYDHNGNIIYQQPQDGMMHITSNQQFGQPQQQQQFVNQQQQFGQPQQQQQFGQPQPQQQQFGQPQQQQQFGQPQQQQQQFGQPQQQQQFVNQQQQQQQFTQPQQQQQQFAQPQQQQQQQSTQASTQQQQFAQPQTQVTNQLQGQTQQQFGQVPQNQSTQIFSNNQLLGTPNLTPEQQNLYGGLNIQGQSGQSSMNHMIYQPPSASEKQQARYELFNPSIDVPSKSEEELEVVGGIQYMAAPSLQAGSGTKTYNPCSSFSQDLCMTTSYCSWGSGVCNPIVESATALSATASGAELYGMLNYDQCIDLRYDACTRVQGCIWDGTTDTCISARVNVALDKAHNALIVAGAPHISSRFLQSFGSVHNGFGVVSSKDQCLRLNSYFDCKDYFGCEWDGRLCVSKAIVDDNIRDICSDVLTAYDCEMYQACAWLNDRCSSKATDFVHTIPLPRRFRTYLGIRGDGVTKKLYKLLSDADLKTKRIKALQDRALEFFRYQFGLNFKKRNNNWLTNGFILHAAQLSDDVLLHISDAELPFGATLIPRRNRIIQVKFFASCLPGHACIVRGAYAAFLGQYSVRLHATEVLEYGLSIVIDEKDNEVFNWDSRVNYPIIANPLGIHPIAAEAISYYGFGIERGVALINSDIDGLVELDYSSSVIFSDTSSKTSSVSSNAATTTALASHGYGTFASAGGPLASSQAAQYVDNAHVQQQSLNIYGAPGPAGIGAPVGQFRF